MNQAQDRIYARRFGVFNHFLYSCCCRLDRPTQAENSKIWNDLVDGFDVERVAKDLHDVGAGYYCITLMQGRKYLLAPNAAYDAIVGAEPGVLCARRDLVADLARVLAAYDIDLYLYFTGDGPYKDADANEKFGFPENQKNVPLSFSEKWASVLREYAVRYGDRVKGWWIDGCYDFFGYDQEKLRPYYRAIKEGNPNAMSAMNNGVKEDGLHKWFEGDELTCGECNDFTVIPPSRDIEGAQAHILAPLGLSPDGSVWGHWNQPGCQISGRELAAYAHRLHDAGGVLTVDIRINPDSTFDPAQLEALSMI